MLAHLMDVSIRSLVLAIMAVIVVWMRRRSRNAALQHAIWTSVICGMLALFAFGQVLPKLSLRILESPASAPAPSPAGFANALLSEEQGADGQISPPVAAATRSSIDWSRVTVYAYFVVALAFLARFFTGTLLVHKLFAGARPAANDAFESGRLTVPVTVGLLRPKIILPSAWREWDREKLDAVLAHEGAHARRRDNLVAALAAVNRCVFWFHPLAWVLERKLALLAEQACDEYSVATLGDRARYATLLLEMATVVDRSHGRLRSHALTMAASTHIRRRIDSLLEEGRTFSRGLSWTACAAVMLCGIPLVWGAGTLVLDHQPPMPSLDLPQRNVPAAPSLAQAPARSMTLSQAQQTPPVESVPSQAPSQPAASTPKFEVATVKPCDNNSVAAGRGAGRNGGRGTSTSPGRFNVTCMTVESLIEISVAESNNPLVNDSAMPFADTRVRGGPAWIRSEQYSITAESNDPRTNGPTRGNTPAARIMRGPMLQALLEERFHLKMHREMEEVPMYALTIAKSGLKLSRCRRAAAIPMVLLSGCQAASLPVVGWDGA